MLLHAQPLLFEFEHQASENLTFIPMCVRFNLDRSALRLTLAQWQALPHAVRTRLACYALEPEVGHFARDLREQVAAAGQRQMSAERYGEEQEQGDGVTGGDDEQGGRTASAEAADKV